MPLGGCLCLPARLPGHGFCWKPPPRCFQSLRWGGFEFGEQPHAIGSPVLELGHGFSGHLFQEKDKTKNVPHVCGVPGDNLGSKRRCGDKVTRGIFSCDPRGSVQDGRPSQHLWDATWGPSPAPWVCVWVCVCLSFFLSHKHILIYSHIPKTMTCVFLALD